MDSPNDNRLVLFVARGTEAIGLQQQLSTLRSNYDESKRDADARYARQISELNTMFVTQVFGLLQQTERRTELLTEPNDYEGPDDDDD